MTTIDLTRFDFHALRFLKSEDVELMTAEEVGQFVLLMCNAWLGGKAASLPNNATLLAKYARCERVSEAVMREWKEGPDGRLYNETLSEEWDAAVSRSAHGMRGAAARWNKVQSTGNAHENAPAMPEHSPSNAGVDAPPLVKPIQANPNQSKTSSSEAAASDAPASPAKPVIQLPLNDGSEYPVSQAEVDEWARLYPAVDVAQELREMRGWLLAEPKKRKTRRGVCAFVTRWLGKEQDKGSRVLVGNSADRATKQPPQPMPKRRSELNDADKAKYAEYGVTL